MVKTFPLYIHPFRLYECKKNNNNKYTNTSFVGCMVSNSSRSLCQWVRTPGRLYWDFRVMYWLVVRSQLTEQDIRNDFEPQRASFMLHMHTNISVRITGRHGLRLINMGHVQEVAIKMTFLISIISRNDFFFFPKKLHLKEQYFFKVRSMHVIRKFTMRNYCDHHFYSQLNSILEIIFQDAYSL